MITIYKIKHFLTYRQAFPASSLFSFYSSAVARHSFALFVISLFAFSAYSQAQDNTIPRTSSGKPSFQGTWSNASITRLTRSSAFDDLIIPQDQVQQLTQSHPQVVRQNTDDNLDKDSKLLDGSDLSRGRGYNAFWIDPGKEYALVNGTRRSRWITEPSDGSIPYHRNKNPREIAKQFGNEKIITANRNTAEGPEVRSLGERCLISFGGSGGPPMLNTLYNNTYQFVQTEDHLMILVEMVHDVRIIPIVDKNSKKSYQSNSQKNNSLQPNVIPRWLGNSFAYWDDDRLVIETSKWIPQQLHSRPIYLSEQAKVTERLQRISESQIFYRFTIDDPTYYRQIWSGEMSFNLSQGEVFEYACHEGNIGMEGILSGARVMEKEKNRQ